MTITVVGIGADGWAGLAGPSRDALARARMILGAERQLGLLPPEIAAERRAWPSPMETAVDEVASGSLGDVVVLASGDPTLHGIGATLVRKAGTDQVHVLPHPSSFSLACARLGWSQADVELVSLVARPPETVIASLQPGRRLVVLVTGSDGAARLARVLAEHGFAASPFVVLEQLGGPAERRVETTAGEATGLVADALHLVAVTVTGAAGHPRTPGLPDDAYSSDGQITKRHIRALTVAALAPRTGERLWDVGAGSGSVAIEWLRIEPSAEAIAVEARADRAENISANALALGVPRLQIVTGNAPGAFAGLPRPDVVFVGGGITTPGLLDACWSALPDGGRLVANAVTLEGERAAAAARDVHGGTLTRIDLAHAEPVGTFTGWRAQMTVIQWATVKGA
ncbi:precorrin-6y C5,15-methyltransferase (decarboxylating) subunit CbiE [Baekduia soli]|uniref:Precorrin-6y C5,15-methyltransferase (Decarboxylating) subunit CbiE n=1 Tax=Baekduia soli TaxID=496014 RepID=A0A5B8U262_9ACTN|nr:precorrin-6y C5,15-methyltransferase (decarboxylating) subunit CbiE [Baekduia soli]QEC47030.1 precorrin-6y C5,15-methyltransferase (decarboxylating) subunit CbiE [Baekduia soli]